MDIYNVIRKEACSLDFSANSKEDCIKKIAKIMADAIGNIAPEKIAEAIFNREASGSTGFEHGVAIPHAKIKGLERFFVGIMVSPKGVDFESIDKKKSNMFFVIVGPDDQPKFHLQLLAQISRFSRNPAARKELLGALSADTVVEAFLRFVGGGMEMIKTAEASKLFFMVLSEMRFFDDIMEIFIGKGISGVNVLDSSGAKNQLSERLLFADFLDFLGERADDRKTIMAVLPESAIKDIVNQIEEVMGDLDKHTGALIMILDIPYLKGTLEV